jgi:glycosyltransferase involved in cell wall biosynthesis
MNPAPRICVIVPVYNHGLTVGRVVSEAKSLFPVIAVDDGSTDDTPAALAAESGVTVVTLPLNRGKGGALRAGFARARELGFTHAITIDADGQHPTAALPEFAAAGRRRPDAFIIGVRDLKLAGAPFGRRATNGLSTFWFRFETGLQLTDTQCGYRCYPLAAILPLRVKSERYAFELEIMVKAAWAGIPLLPQPVAADYAAPTSRLSHFDPWRDMAQISRLHSRLSMQTFCMPPLLRNLSATGQLQHLPRRQRVRTILSHLFSEHTESPGRLAAAVGVGLFCGIAPIWGFQMMAAAALAHKFRLNKAIALTASNISFPLAAPFILAAGLVLGHFLRTGGLVQFNPDAAARQIPLYFAEWFFGSIALALIAGVSGTLAAWFVARLFARQQAQRNWKPE